MKEIVKITPPRFEASRNQKVDILKGIAIISVVIGHCIQFGSGYEFWVNECFYDNYLFKFIYGCHMPLFMLLSGYLYRRSIGRYDFHVIITKKVHSLLVPVVVWSVYEFIWFYDYGTTSLIQSVLGFIEFTICNLWFLWAVFLSSFVVLLIFKYLNDNIYIHLVIYIVSLFFTDGLNLQLYKFVYPFFLIGYYLKNSDFEKMLKVSPKIVFIFAFFLYTLLLNFFSKECYIYVTGMQIRFHNIILFERFPILIIRFLTGLVGCIMVISLVHSMYGMINKRIKDIISLIGTNTMGIYIISDVLNHYLLRMTMENEGFTLLNTLIYSVIVIIISLILTIAIKKNKTLGLVLLGNYE